MITSNYDCYLVDLDGTANVGDLPIPHAVTALNALGDRVVFVTNNASRSPETVAQRLTRIGYRTDPRHILTSAQLACQLLREELAPGTEVLVLGAPYLEELIRQSGFVTVRDETPVTGAVVQGHCDDTGWRELSSAARAIRQGARYFATNRDTSLPSERGLNVGNGAMVGAVEISTGVRATTAGKPSPRSMQQAAHLVGGQHALVIGDRLDTDIEGGVNAGYDTLCVLTGVITVPDICNAVLSQRPTFVLPNLSFIAEILTVDTRLRLDTMPTSYSSSLVELEIDTQGKAIVHFPDHAATSRDKLAALIHQAWHNNHYVYTIVGATADDMKEIRTWKNL